MPRCMTTQRGIRPWLACTQLGPRTMRLRSVPVTADQVCAYCNLGELVIVVHRACFGNVALKPGNQRVPWRILATVPLLSRAGQDVGRRHPLLGVGHLIVPVSARGQTVAFGPGLVVPGALWSSGRNDASAAGGAYRKSEPNTQAGHGLADCGEHAVRVRGNRMTEEKSESAWERLISRQLASASG